MKVMQEVRFTVPGSNRPRKGRVLAVIPEGHIPPASLCEGDQYRKAFVWTPGMTSQRKQVSYLVSCPPEKPGKSKNVLWWINHSDCTAI